MKTIEEYMQMPHKLEITPDGEGGFVAFFPDLPGCLTCGATVEAARTNAIDAKREWLEAAIEQGIHIQELET